MLESNPALPYPPPTLSHGRQRAPALLTGRSGSTNPSWKKQKDGVSGRRLRRNAEHLIPPNIAGAVTGTSTLGSSCAGSTISRPVYLRLGHSFGQEWFRLYKSLIFPEDGDLSQARRRLDAQRQMAACFVTYPDVEGLRAAWLRMSPARRMAKLASILIGSLVDSARKTLMMLTVLDILPREWKTRCECLTYLDLVHQKEIEANADLQVLFAKQIELVSRIWTWPEGSMPRAFLVLLLQHNSPDQCESIVDAIFHNHDAVPVPLILVMVDHFTKTADPNRAIDLLSRIPVSDREDFREEMLARFANLIELDTIEESGAVRNFKILPRLMEFGISVDANMHNLIIDRAISLGSPNVAWELYHFMEAEQIHVDARTHLVLLRDSFERNDRTRMDEIMSAIHHREDLYTDSYLVAYMMHIVRVVCCIDRQLPAESSFSHILAIYDRAYDRAPLVRLGLVDALPEAASSRRLPEPPPAALGFTIWAYVLCQNEERPVSRLWHWVVYLIKQEDEVISEAAKHDILYNGFIHFYCRQPSTLSHGLQVVQEMMELGLCSPTRRTWSEIICGFLQHGQDEAAEKMWRNMPTEDKRSSQSGWEFLRTKFDRSLLAQEMRHVSDERQMPDGVTEVFSDSPSADIELHKDGLTKAGHDAEE